MAMVADGNYREGIDNLERAYETLPHPNVLYNIGLAYLYAGDLETAASYLERYVDEAPPGEAEDTERLLAGIAQRLAQQERPDAPAETAPTQAPETSPSAPDDAVASIRKAAAEIDQIAVAAGSEHLRERAATLRRAADEMEQQRTGTTAAAPGQPPETPATGPAPSVSSPTTQTLAASGQGANTEAYEEQVVSASRFAESPVDAPNATAIITAQDIRLTGLTNVAELVRRVAGVEVNSVTPNHSEVGIRGLSRRTSNKVLILIDGRPLRQDFVGTTWIDFLPVTVEEVERIEVIRGPASALYGADAFSGVINIITRTPGTGDSYVMGSVGNHGQRRAVAGVTGKNGDVSYRASLGFMEAYNAANIVGENRIDIVPVTSNEDISTDRVWANGELRYDIARRTQISLGGGIVNGDHTVQGFSRLNQVTIRDSFQSHTYATLTTPVGLRVQAFWNRFHPSQASAAAVTPGAIDLQSPGTFQDAVEGNVEWNGEVDLLVPQRLTLGGGYRFKSIKNWDWADADHTQNHFALYVQDVLQLTEELKLQVSARMDKHPVLDSLQFSPRGSLVYRFLENQSVRVTAGRAFRGPAFTESYLEVQNGTQFRGISAWGVGNLNLKPEAINSYEIGYTNQATDYFALEVNAYFNQIKDLMFFTEIDQFTVSDFADPGNDLAKFDDATSSFPISTLRFVNERTTYRQVGGELGVRLFPVDGLDVYTNYSIHDTSPDDAAEIEEVRRREQQTSLHKVNAGLQYRAKFGLDTSLDVHWYSDQVWVEQVSDVQRGVAFQAFEVPSFTLINGRVGYRFLGDRLDIGVVGTNLGFVNKRQHPFGQPVDTRVLATAKLRF
jgi:iron complex outermembrane receptor protein